MEHLKLLENTLIDHFNLIRDVCSWKLLQDPIILGGTDIVVQIDESVFVKSKYNIGSVV